MNKDKAISYLLLLIIVFKLVDLYIDYVNAVADHHIVQEAILIILSLALFVYLTIDIRKRSADARRLAQQLTISQERESRLSQQVVDSKKLFFDAMNQQFDQWQLTKAEKEIALFLMKGLSRFEIAELRGKSEKTITNQCSSIYRKAEVTGRHELAALFFDTII